MGRIHDFFLGPGLLSQTARYAIAREMYPGVQKWRWHFAPSYYHALVGFRELTGYYRRRGRAKP
jgi:hypothetical protein